MMMRAPKCLPSANATEVLLVELGDRGRPNLVPGLECLVDVDESNRLCGIEVFDVRERLGTAVAATIETTPSSNDEAYVTFDRQSDIFYACCIPKNQRGSLRTVRTNCDAMVDPNVLVGFRLTNEYRR